VHLITSSKPIVEVYQNVLEAVGEQEQFDQEAPAPAQAESSAAESATVTESTPEESTPATSTMESSMQSTEEPEKQAESMEEPKEQASTSSIHGTMDEERSDDGNLDENPDDLHLPSVDEGSDTFSHLDARTGLPKPERSSLVKMLTNFWAERSSSGWAPLDYPM
jgi:1-phosphatidylinositol-3-phosphate 5-kinase